MAIRRAVRTTSIASKGNGTREDYDKNFSYFSSWVSFAPVHYLYRNRAIHSPSERRSSRKPLGCTCERRKSRTEVSWRGETFPVRSSRHSKEAEGAGLYARWPIFSSTKRLVASIHELPLRGLLGNWGSGMGPSRKPNALPFASVLGWGIHLRSPCTRRAGFGSL
jgi:hypothetical protein